VDTLTVTTRRNDNSNDTLLYDMTEKSSFYMPMSYFHPEDILALDFRYGKEHFYDTLWVKKEDIPHFESIDCNAKYFHRLTSVRNTTHYIDSVVIKNSYVDFNNATVHIYVYM
jgi:hypothetical protein